jgi:ATP-dependent protease ClpP protease subunit
MLFKEINKKHAEAKLYGNIGSWYANGDSFTELLDMVEANKYEELTIRMHCYGGSVLEGTAMYNAMQRTKLKINIIIDGVAASMGCFILPAIENVFIADNAFGMIHRPSCIEGGDADAHLQTAKLLRDMEGSFIKRLTERTNLTAEGVTAMWFDGKDHWLNADEMVRYGIAKKVVPATAKNIKNLDINAVENLGVEAIYNRFSACLDNNNINQNSKLTMKNLLIAAFALQGVTAESEDSVVLAALQAKFKTVTDTADRLEAEAKAKTENQIKALLDQAQAANKFVATNGQKVEDIRATYEKIGQTAGIDALATALGGLGTPTPIAQMIKPDAQGGESTTKDWDYYQKNDVKALEKMQVENPTQFAELYKAKYGSNPA